MKRNSSVCERVGESEREGERVGERERELARACSHEIVREREYSKLIRCCFIIHHISIATLGYCMIPCYCTGKS